MMCSVKKIDSSNCSTFQTAACGGFCLSLLRHIMLRKMEQKKKGIFPWRRKKVVFGANIETEDIEFFFFKSNR